MNHTDQPTAAGRGHYNEEATKLAKLPTAGETAQPTTGENGVMGATMATGQAPTGEQAPTVEKHSPKHKSSRGVPEGYKTTWVPLDLPEADNERIQQVAAVRKVKVGDLLQAVLKNGLAQYEAEFAADAAKYVPTAPGSKTAKKIADMSPEEQEKYAMSAIERQEKALENARKMLADAKAKAIAAASQREGAAVTSI